MSNDFWKKNLPEDHKHEVVYYIGELPRNQLDKIRTMLIEYSLDHIEEPNKDSYEHIIRSVDEYDPVTALRQFVNASTYWWYVREWARFVVGYHKPVPNVAFNLYADFGRHFPHISREDDKRVAIVMDNKKAQQDLHTTMKIGRYLSKQTDCPESAIPDISNEFANRDTNYQLEFARTPAEIQWVYENGPGSCMGKTIKEAGFYTRVHPTHAYATPDIAIAFVRARDNHNRVIARTVVSMINHTFVRIFGNSGIIEKLLKADNWKVKRTNGLDNHRLLNLTQEYHGEIKHIGPYLDSGKFPIFLDPTDDKYLIINPTNTEDLEHIGDSEISYSQKGFIDAPPLITCHYCSGHFSSNDVIFYDTLDDYACQGCQETYMRAVYNRYFEHEYVDEGYEGYSRTFVTLASRSPFSSYRPELQEQEWEFLNQREFEESDYAYYRDSNHQLIIVSDGHYLEDQSMWVLKNETLNLKYSYKRYLKDDIVRINNIGMPRQHLHNGKFKFTTNNGFDIADALNHLHTFYFKHTSSIESDSLIITELSDKPKAGFRSMEEFWHLRMDAYYGVNIVSEDVIHDNKINACIIPSDPDHELFKHGDSPEHDMFIACKAVSITRELRVTDMYAPERFIELRNSYVHKTVKQRRSKSAAKKKPKYENVAVPEYVDVESLADDVDSAIYAATSTASTVHDIISTATTTTTAVHDDIIDSTGRFDNTITILASGRDDTSTRRNAQVADADNRRANQSRNGRNSGRPGRGTTGDPNMNWTRLNTGAYGA